MDNIDNILRRAQEEADRRDNRPAAVRGLYGALKAGSTSMLKVPGGETVDVTGLMIRIMDANDIWTDQNEEKASLWLSTGRAEAKAVGEALDTLVGFRGMQAFHQMIVHLYGGVAAKELEHAWAGVGQWVP